MHPLLNLVFIGLIVALAVNIGLYIVWPKAKRSQARRLVIFCLGSLLVGITVTSGRGNMQIEGLFFGVLAGLTQPPVLHFSLAKIGGPLIFGRVWCGWACWYAMIFDQLPYPNSRHRRTVVWLRYIHFCISLCVVIVLWYGVGYREGGIGSDALVWFVGGYALYILIGIGMAFAFKDNRAFCKYMCPITVPLKWSSRYALLKVKGIPERCDNCKSCVELCPMNIRIPDYILNGERVLSTECTLCQTCINVCPHDALKLSFGLDRGGKDLIDEEAPRRQRKLMSEIPNL